jgi:hypothetical protein
MRAAGIFRNVAADAADGLRGRIGCIEITVVLNARGHIEIDDAGLDEGAGVGEINLENAVHAREADDDAVFHGQRAAAQARARAASDKGNFFAMTQADDGLHLLRGIR